MMIGNGSNLLSKAPTLSEGINYNMAKAEDGYSGYSLSDRELDYQYEALKKQQEEQKKVIAGKIQVPAATKVATQNAIKTENKSGPKKQAEQKKQDQKTTNDLIAQQQTAAKKMEERKALEQAWAAAHVQAVAQQQAKSQDNLSPENSNAADKESKNKTSFAEWRKLIFANPKQETMLKFIEAFRKNEVTVDEYQSMAQDLLDQSRDDLKGLGLMALRAQPSLKSLSQLVHVESELSSSLKSYVQQGYNSYLQSQNITYLNQALKTTDKLLIKRTLTILQHGLQKINSGDIAGLTPIRSRGGQGDSQIFSMNSFKVLLASLALLASNSDSQIASQAQQVAGQINSTNNIAGL